MMIAIHSLVIIFLVMILLSVVQESFAMKPSFHKRSRIIKKDHQDVNDDQGVAVEKGILFPVDMDGSSLRVAIIKGRWNEDIVNRLHDGVMQSLIKCGVNPERIVTRQVPGSFELPITAHLLLRENEGVDVIICLGCLIKGETMHFDLVAQAVTQGIMRVSLDSGVPCVYGVLTVLNKAQAIARCTGDTNEGIRWGLTAVEMGLMQKNQLMTMNPSSPFSPVV